MAKFWRTPQFEALKKEWEEKLKSSGFRDAEEEIGGERDLKQYSSYPYRKQSVTEITREAKLSYFTLLAGFIEGCPRFEDESDRLIMTLTSNGWSIREISDRLIECGLGKFNRDTIRYVRRRYEDKWGIRKWKPEEMVSRRVRTRS